MKKKYFVLRSTSSSGPARLEYYDSEKKFNAGHLPKRSIHLHTCFNINRKSDSRHKNAIALYTKEECFSVVCEDEKEQENWLSLMLEYQNEYVSDAGDGCREHYEFVWQVTVQPKGLGQSMNIRGPYRLCMTRHNICLVKLNMDKPQYIFRLETVRSLAHNDNLFWMEVGKIAPTGEGELWMQADDAVIAQNLHETILSSMKNMDRRMDSHVLGRSDTMHGSSSTLPRQPDFRIRSETFTQGSMRTRTKIDRPISVHTTARSTSHLHSTVSPGTSPHTHSFVDHQIMGSHRLRSDSNESKASRNSMSDDLVHDMHSFVIPACDIMPLREEESCPELPGSFDQRSMVSSPGSYHMGQDDADGYMAMSPGSATPPTELGSGYIDMTPYGVKESREDQGSTYMSMNPSRSSASAPIPIHTSHSHTEHSAGYMDMHNPLPPVKEGGSTEGYLPMSPSCSASPSGSHSSQLRPDRVKCRLSDDGNDFSQPPTRTYSLGSRPVKTGMMSSGYVDMSGRKGVLDNGRSCSAPHLINHHHPHHHRSSRSSNFDSPTPSASPLSMSLKSDDSDSFMELDFYRPRTASDSYSYRPRASSFGVQQGSLGQGHRPRSSSHGQGTRPLRRHRMLDVVDSTGRLNHEAFITSQGSSMHGSFDSLKVSSSESLKKLSQEVRTKTSQLNNSGYMEMGFDKRHTPSPQPSSVASSHSEPNGYVDMTLGNRKSSPNLAKKVSKSNSKTSSSEKLQESDYTNMSLGTGSNVTESAYINYDSHEGKKESPSCSSSTENVDTYVMYEPAASSSGTSGKETSSKGKSASPDPRGRSGSDGKEHKKRSFFSFRHSHSDSGKHSVRKPESSQQPSGVISYSSTGGEKFGSLGRDIRQKSKDSSRSSGRKSNSFSKTFGISTSKPGKLSRKTPTPPKSLDGNDEYIEFSPMNVKSDSDSSHSSGSVKTSRSRREAKEEDYVGYEPGNIPTSTSPSSQKGGSNTSSGYVPMSAWGAGGQGAAFKPVKKSGTRRSKSKDDSSQVQGVGLAPNTHPGVQETSPTHPPAFKAEEKLSGKQASGSQSQPSASVELPKESQLLLKPFPVYPATLPQPISAREGKSQTPLVVPPCPSPQGQSPSPVPVGEPTPAVSGAVPEVSRVSDKSTSSITSPVSATLPLPPLSLPVPMSVSASPSIMQPASLAKPKESGSGYMDFDPGTPGLASSDGTSTVSVIKPEVVQSYISESVPKSSPKLTVTVPAMPEPGSKLPSPPMPTSQDVQSSSSEQSTGKTNTAESITEHAPVSSPSSVSPSSSEPPPVTTSPSSAVSPNGRSRRTPGPGATRSRRKSGDKTSTGSGGGGSGQAFDSTAVGVEAVVEGGQQGKGSGSCVPQSSQSSGGGQLGLTRPESTPCMLSMDKPAVSGRGRGRHCSSSSVGTVQTKKGKASSNNNSNGSKSSAGMLPINTETESRHSIADLSGYEQMSFPSNALVQQQPQGQPQQLSVSSSQGSGSMGGSQGVLNYATLDLGSADSVGDSGDAVRSPRNRSRHSSSADERNAPLSYATIDFEKSESLRNAVSKDSKLTL